MLVLPPSSVMRGPAKSLSGGALYTMYSSTVTFASLVLTPTSTTLPFGTRLGIPVICTVSVPPCPGVGLDWMVGVLSTVGWSAGVLCAGGWLLVLLPCPPAGDGNAGRRSTVPDGVTAVGGVWGEVLFSLKKLGFIALLTREKNNNPAMSTRHTAIINTLYAGSLRQKYISLARGSLGGIAA